MIGVSNVLDKDSINKGMTTEVEERISEKGVKIRHLIGASVSSLVKCKA